MQNQKEFSKIITMILLINVIVMSYITLGIMAYFNNLNALSFFITGVNSCLSVVYGFYFYKAGKENITKINTSYNIPIIQGGEHQLYDRDFKPF